MKNFREYYFGTIIHPSKTFGELINDASRVRLAVGAVAIMAVLYTFVYVFLTYGGGLPFKPWLNISPEDYYKYNVFFCAPSMFIGWILSVSCVHLLASRMSLVGRFDQLLSTFGFSIGIASWTTGIHDFISSFLGAIHVIDQHEFEIALNSPTVFRLLLWILMLAYVAWFVLLFTRSVSVVYKLSQPRAFLLGIAGFLVYQLFFLIFNR